MSLTLLQQLVRAKIADDAWAEDTRQRAIKVALFRDMVDGDHPSNMTREMRNLLNIKAIEGQGEFNDNYMDIVVQTEAERLTLNAVEADNDAATNWVREVTAFNRLDAMQGDVHEGTIRDADSYVMTSFDNDKQMARFTHELAYDGISGIVPVYTSADVAEMDMAFKVWHIVSDGGKLTDTTRVNAYYPDRIQKWISRDGNQLEPFVEPGVTDKDGNIAWVMGDGTPIGIPIIHFRNRGRQNWGRSELENAIPLQHVMNRFLHSFVFAAELTAFRIFKAKGFAAPSGLTPGMIVQILGENGGPLPKDVIADFEAIDGDDLSQYIMALQWISQEIGRVTRTPAPELMGADDSSGEALKQREIGLIGKVERFQVKCGNSWEDVFGLAHKIHTAFGTKKPPAYERFTARWKDAEIRNDAVMIENAIKLRPLIGDEEAIRLVAPIYEWDEKKIQDILKQMANQRMSNLTDIMTKMPQFGGANGQPPMVPGQQPPANGQMPQQNMQPPTEMMNARPA